MIQNDLWIHDVLINNFFFILRLYDRCVFELFKRSEPASIRTVFQQGRTRFSSSLLYEYGPRTGFFLIFFFFSNSFPTIGITNWQTAFWIATFKRLDKSARFPFLILNNDRLKVSSAELDVQAKERPLRRSLPPQEAEGAPQRRQRRSFHGFELVNREQDSGYEPDSEPKMQQDTSTIDIDEAAAA